MENIYCKHLNLGFDLNLDYLMHIQSICKNTSSVKMFENPTENQDTQLVNLFDNHNIRIYASEIFYTPPFSTLPLHIDYDGSYPSFTRINWVIGAPGSTMAWYRLKDTNHPATLLQTEFNRPYIVTDIDSCVKVWEEEIFSACLVEAGEFHMINNPTQFGRVCMSYALFDKETMGPISFTEAINRLKEYSL